MNTVVDGSKGTEVFDDCFQLFRNYMSLGLSSIKKGCDLYVAEIKKNPAIKEEFKERFMWISDYSWKIFEMVGLGTLPELFAISSYKLVNKIMQLPDSDKIKIANERLEILSCDGTKMKMKIQDMDDSQLDQIMTTNSIRSLGQQKMYIESQKMKRANFSEVLKKPLKTQKEWKIFKDGSDYKVAFIKDAIFTKEKLSRILRELNTKIKENI